MANNRSRLTSVPDAIQLEIDQYLSPSDKANVAIACKATLKNAQSLDRQGYYDKSLDINFSKRILPLFFNSRIYASRRDLQQVGLYILTGQKDAALEMINKDPGLLRLVIPSITLKKHPSYVGERHENRTLYQLALGTYDHEIYDVIGECIESRSGHAIKAKQFNEQFPDGIESKNSYRAKFDSLIETIIADSTVDFIDGQNVMNNTTKTALQELEDSMVSLTNKHSTGGHFDLQIVTDTIAAYYESSMSENESWKKRTFYWRCVFGMVEKYIPYFVAMALNEQVNVNSPYVNFVNVLRCQKNVTRSTRMDNGSDFFNSDLGLSKYHLEGRTMDHNFFGFSEEDAWRVFVSTAQKKLNLLRDNCNKQQIHVYKK